MILNEGNLHKIREIKRPDTYDTYLLNETSSESDSNSNFSESVRKYRRKPYKLPSVRTSEISIILKELLVEYCAKVIFLICFICIILFCWLYWIDTPQAPDPSSIKNINRCSGIQCHEQTCARAKKHEITGNLCMDLCYSNTVRVPKCSNHLSDFANCSYQYYSLGDHESNLICLPNSGFQPYDKIKEGIGMDEFRSIIYDKIMTKINEPITVERIIDKILMFTDVNHDLKLSLTEADTLWMLLNQKYTYYMLTLSGKSYIPKIVDFCGTLIQIEDVKNYLYESNNYSLLKSVFLSNNNWVKIQPKHKLKISLGILEFFLDSVSHNPNDDFGPQSLFLCSSVESSFGYTFINEAKLINYDYIFNGHELEKILSNRVCSSDLDCQYTKECTTKCDLNRRKCTSKLITPQVTVFCDFFQEFLSSNPELKNEFKQIIQRCLKLTTFYQNEINLYSKNEMPFEFSEQEAFVKKRDYWNASMEYTLVTKELHNRIWEKIKLVNDPVKPKKSTHKPSAGGKDKNLNNKN